MSAIQRMGSQVCHNYYLAHNGTSHYDEFKLQSLWYARVSRVKGHCSGNRLSKILQLQSKQKQSFPDSSFDSAHEQLMFFAFRMFTHGIASWQATREYGMCPIASNTLAKLALPQKWQTIVLVNIHTYLYLPILNTAAGWGGGGGGRLAK